VLRLSIVIPILGDPQQLDDTLVSVLENRPANCEILIVHNEPYHDPYNLSDEVRFVEARRGAGLAECLNQALVASRAPVVHVLACGVEVGAGWADAAMPHFREPAIAAVAATVLHRGDGRKIFSAGLGYRPEGASWKLVRPYEPDARDTDSEDLCGPDTLAAFYRKSAIEAVGGFSPWLGDAAVGIDLALALRQAGFRCVWEPRCLAHVGVAAMRDEPAFRRGRQAERLFWRWASSHGWLRSLVSHAALVAGECVIGLWRPSMLVQLVGRACGMLQAALSRRSRKRPEFAICPMPSVVGKPHFAAAGLNSEQRTARVA
jgi:GT2 family glycosyltransferase